MSKTMSHEAAKTLAYAVTGTAKLVDLSRFSGENGMLQMAFSEPETHAATASSTAVLLAVAKSIISGDLDFVSDEALRRFKNHIDEATGFVQKRDRQNILAGMKRQGAYIEKVVKADQATGGILYKVATGERKADADSLTEALGNIIAGHNKDASERETINAD